VVPEVVRQVVPGDQWVVPGEAMGGSLEQLGGSPEVVQVDMLPRGRSQTHLHRSLPTVKATSPRRLLARVRFGIL